MFTPEVSFWKINNSPRRNHIKIYRSSDLAGEWISSDTTILLNWADYKKLLRGTDSLFFYSTRNCKETVNLDIYLPGNIMRKISNDNSQRLVNSHITEHITCDFKKSNQIVLEPITNEIVPGTFSELYNPACVVIKSNASFKIEVNGPDFSSDSVTWKSKKGKVQFVDGEGNLSGTGSGPIVKVKGMSAGEDTLEVSIPGYFGEKPRIEFSVVTPVTVDINTYIVKDRSGMDSAWTDTEIDQMIDSANGILKQIGVYLKRIKGPAISKDNYYNIKLKSDFIQIGRDICCTGGLELYLNRSLQAGGTLAGNVINVGIIFPKINQLSARGLAHEIMHSARQSYEKADSIYVIDVYDHVGKEFAVSSNLKILSNNLKNDFGSNYYKSDSNHIYIIKKLLQYGYPKVNALDIPQGDIFGIGPKDNSYTSFEEKQIECGFLKRKERIFEHKR